MQARSLQKLRTIMRTLSYLLWTLFLASPFAHAHGPRPLIGSVMEPKTALAKIRDTGIDFVLIDRPNNQLPMIQNYGEVHRSSLSTPNAELSELVFNQSLKSLLQRVQADHGHVVLDCGLFTQISALILSDRMDEPETILFALGKGHPAAAAKMYNISFAYVRPALEEEFRRAQHETDFLYKGHWLIYLGSDQYLGLSKNGAEIANAEQWILATKNGLFHEIDIGLATSDVSCRAILTNDQATLGTVSVGANFDMYNLLRQVGRLKEWIIVSYPPQR